MSYVYAEHFVRLHLHARLLVNFYHVHNPFRMKYIDDWGFTYPIIYSCIIHTHSLFVSIKYNWKRHFILIQFHLLQLYKTRDEKYLLDLQRVSGPQLLFLDLCSAFLTQLRVL